MLELQNVSFRVDDESAGTKEIIKNISLTIPAEAAAEEGEISSLTFDLILKNAADETEILGTVPVTVTTRLKLPETM